MGLLEIQHPVYKKFFKETNWLSMLKGLSVGQMVELCTYRLNSTIKANIPSRVLSINDKDPPWITRQVKAAVKCKHRAFRGFINSVRGKKIGKIFRLLGIENGYQH